MNFTYDEMRLISNAIQERKSDLYEQWVNAKTPAQKTKYETKYHAYHNLGVKISDCLIEMKGE